MQCMLNFDSKLQFLPLLCFPPCQLSCCLFIPNSYHSSIHFSFSSSTFTYINIHLSDYVMEILSLMLVVFITILLTSREFRYKVWSLCTNHTWTGCSLGRYGHRLKPGICNARGFLGDHSSGRRQTLGARRNQHDRFRGFLRTSG